MINPSSQDLFSPYSFLLQRCQLFPRTPNRRVHFHFVFKFVLLLRACFPGLSSLWDFLCWPKNFLAAPHGFPVRRFRARGITQWRDRCVDPCQLRDGDHVRRPAFYFAYSCSHFFSCWRLLIGDPLRVPLRFDFILRPRDYILLRDRRYWFRGLPFLLHFPKSFATIPRTSVPFVSPTFPWRFVFPRPVFLPRRLIPFLGFVFPQSHIWDHHFRAPLLHLHTQTVIMISIDIQQMQLLQYSLIPVIIRCHLHQVPPIRLVHINNHSIHFGRCQNALLASCQAVLEQQLHSVFVGLPSPVPHISWRTETQFRV